MFLLLAAGLAAAQAELPAGPSADLPAHDSYRGAIETLLAGDARSAAQQLWQIVEADPNHAGAWLDLGLLYCDQGKAAAAARIFAHVERRFNPAPAIRELIAEVRKRGCQTAAPAPPQRNWNVQLGLRAGHDSNPNLGLGTDRLTLRIGGIPTPVDLAAASRPRPSSWQALDLQGEIRLDSAWRLQAGLLHSRYAAGADLAQDRLVLAASRSAARSETQFWLSRHWFGAEPYQDGLGLRRRAHLGGQWETDVTLQRNRYPGRRQLDAWLFEPRLGWRQALGGGGSLLLSAGPQLDQPVAADRPGGRRTGGIFQAELQQPLAAAWRLEAGLRLQHQRDAESYSPLFGNEKRRQSLAIGWLSINRAIAPATRCAATLQGLQSRDRIPLYDYAQQIVSLGCQHEF